MMPHSSALAPDLAGGSTPITISAYSAVVAPGAIRWRSISARVQSAPGASSTISANSSCRPIVRPCIAGGDALDERRREMMGVVESRTAGDDRVLVLDELFDELGRTRRRGDHRLRLVAEAQAQQRLVERVGIAPGGEFIEPQLHVLFSPQPVRLLGREQLRHRAVGPGEARGGARIVRPLAGRADRHQPGFAEHHDVAHVVVRRADQIDDREGLDPFGAPPRRPQRVLPAPRPARISQ